MCSSSSSIRRSSSSRDLQPALSGFGLIVITVRTACLMEHWELITAQGLKKKRGEDSAGSRRSSSRPSSLALCRHMRARSAVVCLSLSHSAVCLRSRQHVATEGKSPAASPLLGRPLLNFPEGHGCFFSSQPPGTLNLAPTPAASGIESQSL